MALETLKGVKEIGGFELGHMDDASALTKEEFKANGNRHVVADHNLNSLTFFIQNGPIKENGVNGCTVTTVIQAALMLLRTGEQNSYIRGAILGLKESIKELDARPSEKDG